MEQPKADCAAAREGRTSDRERFDQDPKLPGARLGRCGATADLAPGAPATGARRTGADTTATGPAGCPADRSEPTGRNARPASAAAKPQPATALDRGHPD